MFSEEKQEHISKEFSRLKGKNVAMFETPIPEKGLYIN
jgi:hypothetical protein